MRTWGQHPEIEGSDHPPQGLTWEIGDAEESIEGKRGKKLKKRIKKIAKRVAPIAAGFLAGGPAGAAGAAAMSMRRRRKGSYDGDVVAEEGGGVPMDRQQPLVRESSGGGSAFGVFDGWDMKTVGLIAGGGLVLFLLMRGRK